VAQVVRRCPTGALHYRLLAEKPEEPPHPTIITPDPRGPLLVRGDLVLDTPNGPLAETRAALCACARTRNQPFCDGACGVNGGPFGGTRDQAETPPGALSQRLGACASRGPLGPTGRLGPPPGAAG
jgi:CDGSH-type Zn-finger protein